MKIIGHICISRLVTSVHLIHRGPAAKLAQRGLSCRASAYTPPSTWLQKHDTILDLMRAHRDIAGVLHSLPREAINAVNSRGRTLLSEAVHFGAVNMTRLVLAAGGNPNVRDTANTPMLHFALSSGFKNISELLIESGADVHALDGMLRTALHWAALRGYKEIVEALLKRGAKKDLPDKSGITPRVLAQQTHQGEILPLI